MWTQLHGLSSVRPKSAGRQSQSQPPFAPESAWSADPTPLHNFEEGRSSSSFVPWVKKLVGSTSSARVGSGPCNADAGSLRYEVNPSQYFDDPHRQIRGATVTNVHDVELLRRNMELEMRLVQYENGARAYLEHSDMMQINRCLEYRIKELERKNFELELRVKSLTETNLLLVGNNRRRSAQLICPEDESDALRKRVERLEAQVSMQQSAVKTTAMVRGNRVSKKQKATRSSPPTDHFSLHADWKKADCNRWNFQPVISNGGYSFSETPVFEKVNGLIQEGVQKLMAEPVTYEGILYQTNMASWPPDKQSYKLLKRTGSGVAVKQDSSGNFTWVLAKYQALKSTHPSKLDAHTDSLHYKGNRLPEPVSPGRGYGYADVPGLKIIGHASPYDVTQGHVGDCWLLSAISALAEFQGAVEKLFRQTNDLKRLPMDGDNEYVITLYDLSTWQPVHIRVDERLCRKADGIGLLGCSPSASGELWTCYLEKAVAIHCGGWDEIDGGTCVHAWQLLTGCRHQYTFTRDKSGFSCFGALNPNTGRWELMANSPHRSFQGLWPMPWPSVGSGGSKDLKVDDNSMFERMCAWDDHNYMIACAARQGSDKHETDGIVDGHAYTVIDCINDAGGTKFDMIKIRNPWGHGGEYKSKMWGDDGPGWHEYPTVAKDCKPVEANDGVFWMEKAEFFSHFKTIYLCALDMAEFVAR